MQIPRTSSEYHKIDIDQNAALHTRYIIRVHSHHTHYTSAQIIWFGYMHGNRASWGPFKVIIWRVLRCSLIV